MSDTPESFAPRSDGQPVVLEHSRAPERMAADKVRCEACPVLCQISPGKLGACDRYGNVDGVLTRLDTLHLVAKPGVDNHRARAADDQRPQGKRDAVPLVGRRVCGPE